MIRVPRVSIGVPVFNGERYLAQALDSLLAQTYEDFELVISDNASTDRTGEIAQHYAARDPRVRYLRSERNRGAGWNYRRTFELARGEYFRWAPADDLSGRESVARCVEILDQERSVVLAYPKTRFIDGQGQLLSEYEDRLHLLQPRASERLSALMERLGYCNALYGLIRADALRSTALLGSYVGADVVLLAELVLRGAFWEIPEVLFSRRFHGSASSQMTLSQRERFWNPTYKSRIRLHVWRQCLEIGRAIGRAPLDLAEKVHLFLVLGRTAVSRRHELAREVAITSGRLLRRSQS